MSKIVAIANVAGGTGKTTTAHALAVACVEYGKKVLLLDLDALIPDSELVYRALSDTTSVITLNNGSEIASAYRELAYSLLEKLKLI